MKRWYATEPMGMAGTSASARRLATCTDAALFDGAVNVHKQHVNPTIGRPTGLGGPSSG